MKRFIFVLIASLVFVPIVSAQVMHEFNTTINAYEDRTSQVEFSFKFADYIKEIEIPVSYEITDLITDNGKCEVRKEIGNILHCEPLSPFIVGIIKITSS